MQQEGDYQAEIPKRRASSRLHILVQFRQQPQEENIRKLVSRGATVLAYVPDYAFVISADDSILLDDLDLDRVERLCPQDKLSPLLGRAEMAEMSVAPDAYVVEFHPDVDSQDAREIAFDTGLVMLEHADLLPGQYLVEGTLDDVMRLADWDEVAYIFPASRELKDGERVYACAGAATAYGQTGQYTATYGEGWDGPGRGAAQIGYYLGALASALPRAQVQTEILRAFAGWSASAAVTFVPASAPNAARTISLLFARRSHGDSYPFDGPGKVLAHTFYPSPPNPETIAGDMHFDDDEAWGVGQGMDVFSVTLHEAGHALGLGHSDQPGSVMYPYYKRVTALAADDISAILTLYAEPGGSTGGPNPAEPTEPTQPTQPTQPTNPTTPTAPTLVITSPLGPTQVSTPSINVQGTADHADGVARVTWTSSRGGSGTASGTRTWVAGPISLQPGANLITATAFAVSGTQAMKSVSVTYAAANDKVPPKLIIRTPPTTSVATSASAATLAGTATDNVAVEEVTWSDSAGNTGTAQGTARWTAGPIPLRVGANTITIRARDAAGNTAWRSIVYTRR